MTGSAFPASLLSIVACPVCLASLEPGSGPTPSSGAPWLRCTGCSRRYPVVDGIPVLLAERASLEP